jgi:hypothetical protein
MRESRHSLTLLRRLTESIAGNFLADILRATAGTITSALGGSALITKAVPGVIGTAFSLLLIIGGAYLLLYTLISKVQQGRNSHVEPLRLALLAGAGDLLDELEKIELWNSKAEGADKLDLTYPLSGHQFPGDIKQWNWLLKELFKWSVEYNCFVQMCYRANVGAPPPLGSHVNIKKLIRILDGCRNGSFPTGVPLPDVAADYLSATASAE